VSLEKGKELIYRIATMNENELHELGHQVSTSMFPSDVQKILFRAIEVRRDELNTQIDSDQAFVVVSEYEID
jgi:hypothetical protein